MYTGRQNSARCHRRTTSCVWTPSGGESKHRTLGFVSEGPNEATQGGTHVNGKKMKTCGLQPGAEMNVNLQIMLTDCVQLFIYSGKIKKKKNNLLFLSLPRSLSPLSLYLAHPSSSHPPLARTSKGAAKNVTAFGKQIQLTSLFFFTPSLFLHLQFSFFLKVGP